MTISTTVRAFSSEPEPVDPGSESDGEMLPSLLANHILHEAVPENLGTSTIFLLALFVATAEIFVLAQFAFGFLFSILSIWGYRTRTRPGESR